MSFHDNESQGESQDIMVQEGCGMACGCQLEEPEFEEVSCCAEEENPNEEIQMTDEIQENHEKKKEKKNNSHLDGFLAEMEQKPTPEAKLEHTIQFMESSLAQTGTPHLKSFWDARTICLQLFKENINPALRAQMWNKYTELSQEARRLKEILDEQSAFAAEQIEIAIQALENDVNHIDENLNKLGQINFGLNSQWMEGKLHELEVIQRELNYLNAQASRINGLRKELIRTEMRIRIKNKFFQRLSSIGDKVFPRRKELIKSVSNLFSNDVDKFIETYFSKGQVEEALFFLREEIKSLQGFAKILTLNTHSFTHTRMRLSECWDKLKLLEKDRKKERAQQKAVFKQNEDAVMEKINAFKQGFEASEFSMQDALKKLEEISSFMREVDLGREEISFLRDQLAQARKPINEKIKAQDEERNHHEQERERQKKKRMEEIKLEIEMLIKNADAFSAEKLTEERQAILERIQTAQLNKIEKNELERLLKPLRDFISDKQEQAMMTLSDDDKEALQQLREVLAQRKERRQECKEQLETYRKASNSSGYDFEQAMKVNAQISTEKERLAKIDQGVKEIEQKISQLQKKVRG